jgi:hypothetical protein
MANIFWGKERCWYISSRYCLFLYSVKEESTFINIGALINTTIGDADLTNTFQVGFGASDYEKGYIVDLNGFQITHESFIVLWMHNVEKLEALVDNLAKEFPLSRKCLNVLMLHKVFKSVQ